MEAVVVKEIAVGKVVCTAKTCVKAADKIVEEWGLKINDLSSGQIEIINDLTSKQIEIINRFCNNK